MDGERARKDDGSAVERLADRLDLLDDFADVAAGGSVGFASGVEIFTDSLSRGPDDLFDPLDRLRDLDEGAEVFGELDF